MFYFTNMTKKDKAWAIASAFVGLTSGLFFKGYPGSAAPGGIAAYLSYHTLPWVFVVIANCTLAILLSKWVRYADYRHLDSDEKQAWANIPGPFLTVIVCLLTVASITYHPAHVKYLNYLAN